jgi:hypothetical protein
VAVVDGELEVDRRVRTVRVQVEVRHIGAVFGEHPREAEEDAGLVDDGDQDSVSAHVGE